MPKREIVDHIANDLLQSGVRPDGVLMVHSSLSSLGSVAGGPETVVAGILEALGAGGTLLMPALSYQHVTGDTPVFDAGNTPSNVGLIPEHFRLHPDSRRSIHPTHSVCAQGRLAEELVADHESDDTPCGSRSPFRRLPDYNGQILMLGCGLKPNTSMHALEEIVEPPYLFGPDQAYRIVHPDGAVTAKIYRPHGFDGWRQRYDRVEGLLDSTGLKTGKVLEATAHVLEAKALWAAALAVLEREPLYFVGRV